MTLKGGDDGLSLAASGLEAGFGEWRYRLDLHAPICGEPIEMESHPRIP
jgi:hypothetical protein